MGIEKEPKMTTSVGL